MTPWHARSLEERNLLNPGFCSMLLWQAAQGYASGPNTPMPFELSFMVLPFVLHGETRQCIPRNITTSLPVWLAEYPIVLSHLAERASMLRTFTREALVFGGTHGMLTMDHAGVHASPNAKKRVTAALKSATDEVRDCAKRAEFLGRWFEKTGGPETVMALLGVRP